jgi:hypothetical protein
MMHYILLTVVASDHEAKVMLQHCDWAICPLTIWVRYFLKKWKTWLKENLCVMLVSMESTQWHDMWVVDSGAHRPLYRFTLTSPVVYVSEIKYFATFIDCYSQMTWIYLMKQKNEVLTCFMDFYSMYISKIVWTLVFKLSWLIMGQSMWTWI